MWTFFPHYYCSTIEVKAWVWVTVPLPAKPAPALLAGRAWGCGWGTLCSRYSLSPARTQIAATRWHTLDKPRDCLIFPEEWDRPGWKTMWSLLLISTTKLRLNIKGRGPTSTWKKFNPVTSSTLFHIINRLRHLTPFPLPSISLHKGIHQFQTSNTLMLPDSQNTSEHVNHLGRWAEDYCALEKVLS